MSEPAYMEVVRKACKSLISDDDEIFMVVLVSRKSGVAFAGRREWLAANTPKLITDLCGEIAAHMIGYLPHDRI